jgi:hypothetical protein
VKNRFHKIRLFAFNLDRYSTGVLAPKKFIQRLKRDNELFRSFMHQGGSVVQVEAS